MSVTRRLARLRVPLGFAFGIAVVWLATPCWTSLVWGLPIAALGEALRIWAAGRGEPDHHDPEREAERDAEARQPAGDAHLSFSFMRSSRRSTAALTSSAPRSPRHHAAAVHRR